MKEQSAICKTKFWILLSNSFNLLPESKACRTFSMAVCAVLCTYTLCFAAVDSTISVQLLSFFQERVSQFAVPPQKFELSAQSWYITNSVFSANQPSDGSTIRQHSDGSTIRQHSDGSTIRQHMDGSTIRQHRDGSTICQHSDGATIRQHSDGST